MMKKSLTRLLFQVRFVYKNIISSPLKSILMLIGFLGVFTSLILGFSMKDFFTSYYYGKLEETYENYDLIMSVSPNGNTRFFSTSVLQTDDQINEVINEKAMFFEFDVLLQASDQNRQYVHVKASHLDMLKKINRYVYYQDSLLDDEMIITESLALEMKLDVGNEVFIQVNEQQKTFKIVEVVKDDMLFDEMQIFIDKTEGLPFFLNALSPSLASLNPILLSNIYNKVYIDIHASYEINDVITILQSKEPYRLLTYNITVDDDAIQQFIQRNITAFFMIISISLFAIMFVLKTTLEVYFHEKKQLYATIHILGGKKRFSIGIVMMEMLIFFLISFLLAISLSQLIINFGLNYLASDMIYKISYIRILYALLISMVLLCAVVYFYFKKFFQVSDIKSLKDLDDRNKLSKSLLLGIIIFFIFVYMILSIDIIESLFDGYHVIIILIITLYILVYLVKLSFFSVKKYWFKKHDRHIGYYHIKAMLTKSTFKHYLNLVLIAFLTILLLVFANDYMVQRAEAYQQTYELDFIIGNITSKYDDKYIEIESIYEVEDISKAGLFQEVKIANENQTIKQLISMNSEDIQKFFHTNISDDALRDLNKVTTLYVILPDRYTYLYDYHLGDEIEIYVNGEYKEQTFIIAGFFEKQLGDLAFTNLHHVYDEGDIYNVFLVNASGQKHTLKDILLDAYSQELISIFDVEDEMAPLIFEMRRVTTYITFILAIIIICFLVALMNHSILLYHDLKEIYARMFVLGMDKTMMTKSLIKVFVTIFLVLWLISTIGYVLIAVKMSDLAILFGEYEPIRLSIKPIWLGGILLILTFSVNQLFYILKVNQVDAIEVLKINRM